MKYVSYEAVDGQFAVMTSDDGNPPHTEVFRGPYAHAEVVFAAYVKVGYHQTFCHDDHTLMALGEELMVAEAEADAEAKGGDIDSIRPADRVVDAPTEFLQMVGRAHRRTQPTPRVWKGIYANPNHTASVDTAILELMKAHPEWELDMDAVGEWDNE